LTRNCADITPEELLVAVDQFNRGDWFGCHETLEELWAGEKGEMRDFFQGILQVAAALHHWRNGNFRGAVILLEKGGGLLRRVPTECQGVDVDGVVVSADRLLAALASLSEERMAELDPALLPKLRFIHPPVPQGGEGA
jgi:uncharacterized protein